ncbi:hypothetical protein GCM10025868_21580 [Angustibacter aerolatus]|uniref:Uncharacterized protein n=1 Tax=Angustibacter aerolatus TaxID=1162965 RepID=A0ABQ6JFG0_9ACTN|nr:hypothetical protein [Angustibacter aerolatus]GMA86908.1 hypothetical protein GCM10025868_21580 [Angustibacter aerolatus]
MTTTTCPAARPTTTAATATGEGASADGLPYHRLPHLDARSARWWRPFSTLAVGVGLLLAVAVLGLLVLLVAALTTQQGSFPAALTPSPGLDDPRNPMDLVVDLGSLGLLLPVVVLAARWGGRRRGTVHSVAGRFRWGTALRAGAVVLPLHAVVLWTLTAIAPPADLSLPPVGASLVAVVVVVLLLTPLQCAAEEYVFRGLPAQAARHVVALAGGRRRAARPPLRARSRLRPGRPGRRRGLRPRHGVPGLEERRAGGGGRRARREQPAAVPRRAAEPEPRCSRVRSTRGRCWCRSRSRSSPPPGCPCGPRACTASGCSSRCAGAAGRRRARARERAPPGLSGRWCGRTPR